MKYFLLNFTIFCIFSLQNFSIAQDSESKKLVKSGTITLINGENINFSNLSYEIGEQVKYINVKTQQEEHLFLPSITNIEESEVIFINPKDEIEEIKEEENPYILKTDYPEGIYVTKEDFIQKKPSKFDKVIPKGLYGLEKPELSKAEHNNFFYYADTNKKIKKVFAISYEGNLFFQINSILKHRNKTDRAQESDFGNSFVRVILGGENYLYTEADLANAWTKGFAYGGVGGTAGHYLAQSAIKGKGIVWDYRNQEFNIFKNCKDFNEFMQENHPKGMLKCENQQPDKDLILKAIEEIK